MCKHRGKREVSKRPGRRPRSAASLLAAAATGFAALLVSSSWVAAAEKPEEDSGPPPLACEETALGTARTFMRQLGHRPERYRTSVVWEADKAGRDLDAHVIFDPLESTGFDGYGLSVRVPMILSECRVFEPFQLRAEWCSPWNDRCQRPLSARQDRLRRIALGRMKDCFGKIVRLYERPSPPESDTPQTPDESALDDRCIVAVYRRALASNDLEDFSWLGLYEMPQWVTLVAWPKPGLDPCEETRTVRPYYGECGKGIPTEEARAVLSGEASASGP